MGARFKILDAFIKRNGTMDTTVVSGIQETLPFDSTAVTDFKLIHDISDTSGFAIAKDANELVITNDSAGNPILNGFDRQYIYMNYSTGACEIGSRFGTGGGGAFITFGTTAATSRVGITAQNAAGENTFPVLVEYNGGISASPPNSFSPLPVALSAKDFTVNSNIVRSVIAGGDGVVANKNDYLFVENLEVQGGIAAYTADPTLNGAWGARSIPDKAYVDAQIGANNELSEVLSNGNTTGGTDIAITSGDSITGTAIIPIYAGTDYLLTGGNVGGAFTKSWVQGTPTYAGMGFGANAEFGSTSTQAYINDGGTGGQAFSASGTKTLLRNATEVELNLGGTRYLNITSSALVINDTGASFDTRIAGDTDANLLFADASTDRVGVGTNTPAELLDVDGVAKTNAVTQLIDTLTSATTIDIDSNALSDGAYKTLSLAHSVTLNATTAYKSGSPTDSIRWSLEVTQHASLGPYTLTLGTNFLTPGGVAIAVSSGASNTDTLIFETDSAGKHRLIEHRKAYA